jgi:DNA-binding FadR family transcriptional regulator
VRQIAATEGALPLQTVEPTRLYRQIAGQIAVLIDDGEFPAGSRLPPERALAQLLGVSRTSVREAIIALEIAGRVEVRVGTGIFVRARAKAPRPGAPAKSARAAGTGAPPLPDGGASPFDLLAARALIEGEVAALAARRAHRADLVALNATIEEMRALAGDADFAGRDAADRAFHVRLAEASGNDALPAVVAGLWDQRCGDLWTRTERHFHTPALRAKTIDDHAAIVAALASRDPAAARTAMQRHLARVAREFQRGFESTDGAGSKPAPSAAATVARRASRTTPASRRPTRGGMQP